MKRILFIGHDAGRSGAPFVLLHLIRWLREKHPDAAFDVLLLRGGDLEAEYRQLSEVFVVPDERGTSLLGRGMRVFRRQVQRAQRLRTYGLAPYRREYDVVLGNTIATLDHLEYFKAKGFRTVCWMHELEFVITSMFTRERFLELSRSIDCFITVSKAVDATLRRIGVSTESQVVYEFSPQPSASDTEPAALKRELGFPEESFLVGGGGTVEWRKGTDLFLQIAAVVSRAEPNIRFVWVGGADDSSTDYARMMYDLKRLGVRDKVVFTGITDRPERYLSAIDVFALTSREDPFPLICLEAAGLGKPIVCFENAGGMPEFVERDAGAVVPYGDIYSFSEQIILFERDRQRAAAAGRNARDKSTSRFSAENSCRSIEEILLER